MGVGSQHHAPAALPPGKTHCTGGWVGPRTGLDGCGKSRPHRDSIPGSSSPQRFAIPTELPRPIYMHVSLKKYTFKRLRASVDTKFGEQKRYAGIQSACLIQNNFDT